MIIVGDIHACFQELQALLDLCLYRPGVDLLVSVGDLINKGPEPEKVTHRPLAPACPRVPPRRREREGAAERISPGRGQKELR